MNCNLMILSVAFALISSVSSLFYSFTSFSTGGHNHMTLFNLNQLISPSDVSVPSKSPRKAPGSGILNSPLKIIIAGPPASGKGTQCEKITNEYGIVHLSTGDILRAEIKMKSDLGRIAKKYMEAGELVPDELVMSLVNERLQRDDCKRKGWLLDGYPRTKAQAQSLINANIIPDAFILLNVDDDILVERVVGRRTDPVTGKIYHMKFNPPPDDEIFSRLIQRIDDTESKVKIRISDYKTNIDAVKSFFPDKIIVIDGTQTPEKVTKDVLATINNIMPSKVISQEKDSPATLTKSSPKRQLIQSI